MAISLATEAAAAKASPARRHNARERKVCQTVKTYVDAQVDIAGQASIDASILAAMAGVKILKAQLFTTQGSDAIEVITISGVAATDVAIVTLAVKGSTPRTILTAACTTNTVTVTLSGDPSTDHVLAVLVVRPA